MKKLNQLLLAVSCAAIFIISCKTTKTGSTTSAPAPPPPPTVVLTYNASIKNILDANCNGCHRGGDKGDFTNYAGVKSKVDNGSFNERVFIAKDMPPKEPLAADELTKLKKWLEAGAPE